MLLKDIKNLLQMFQVGVERWTVDQDVIHKYQHTLAEQGLENCVH